MNKSPLLPCIFLILACFLYLKAQRLSWPLVLERGLLLCKFLTAAWLRVDLQEFILSQQGAVAVWVSKQPWRTRVEIKSRASWHPCVTTSDKASQVPHAASAWVTLHHHTRAFLYLGPHVHLWIGLFPDPLKSTWDYRHGWAPLQDPLSTYGLALQDLPWNAIGHGPLRQPQTCTVSHLIRANIWGNRQIKRPEMLCT